MKKKVINWKIINIVIIFMCFISIFAFSNISGKKSNFDSERLLRKIIYIFQFNEENNIDELAKNYNVLFRKILHAVEYIILAVFLMKFLSYYNTKIFKSFIIVLFIGFIYSIFDEFHQYFVDSRNASIMDCLIDTVGVLIGIEIYMLIYGIYCVMYEIIKANKEKNKLKMEKKC